MWGFPAEAVRTLPSPEPHREEICIRVLEEERGGTGPQESLFRGILLQVDSNLVDEGVWGPIEPWPRL